MVRKILGVIVGYIAMVIFIMVSFSLVYLAMGADNAYMPNSYKVSTLWVAVSGIGLGIIGALIGGYICKLISQSAGAVKVFAGIIFVLGLVVAVLQMNSEKPNEVRTSDVSNFEAMRKGQAPLWFTFLNPVIGAIGILIGGGLRKDD